MLIDIGACSKAGACTDCIAACHRVHNVPESIKGKGYISWIRKAPFEEVLPDEQTTLVRPGLKGAPVLALCNHCENPPCVAVCPTKATFRRADGIVMMDYHRCIGCRYCMAACPYGSRSFNWEDPRPFINRIDETFPTRTKGVVEKCNFCEERLAKGQMPACVEACREGGMYFFDLNDRRAAGQKLLQTRYAIVRKAALGTKPSVFYLV
jgi:molybdopterin-containing oxidoreductase family iron-sulfur binding subunit